MAPLSPRTTNDRETAVTPIYEKKEENENEARNIRNEAGGTLTLKRKVALCMGLTASEAMGVFSTLNELPLLQAFGSPLYLMTLPGVISASCGLVFVPLVGWLADRGPTPHKRKKPVTVAAFCVGLLGMSLNLLASVLSTGAPKALHHSDTNSLINDSVHHNTSMPYLINSTSPLITDNQSILPGWEDVVYSSPIPNFSNESEVGMFSEGGSTYSIITSTVFGLPVLVLISMLGFIFMDFGFDLSNSGVKALMLTHSPPVDHVSLVVIGVFMAALGGCCTSVSGLVDLGSFLPDINPVSSQAIVQLCTLITLSLLCCACSILSAPRLVSPQKLTTSDDGEQFSPDSFGAETGGNTLTASHGSRRMENRRRSSTAVVPLLPTETGAAENVFYATMTPAEALMSHSTQVERSFMHLSMSMSMSQSHHLLSVHHNHNHHHHHHHQPDSATEKIRLLAPESTHQYEAIPEDTEATRRGGGSEGVMGHPKLKMFVVWLAAFFTGCSTFIFNIIIADYVGKVVYGGNPQAEAGSEEYLLYQQGMRTGALCVLVMNMGYVTSALCQNKVLSVISPKAEYVIISLLLTLTLTAMHQTANLYAIIAGSVAAGTNRTALYTVPFLLATELCQQTSAENVSPEDGEQARENNTKFGSTMALMTSALPSAYLVVSCVIGPLVDATGDPSAPLLMAVVCSVMSALTICCYRTQKKTLRP